MYRRKTLLQIQQKGLEVLVDKLGPADAIRFLQSNDRGSGDWTKDREKFLETDTATLIKNIKERREKMPVR